MWINYKTWRTVRTIGVFDDDSWTVSCCPYFFEQWKICFEFGKKQSIKLFYNCFSVDPQEVEENAQKGKIFKVLWKMDCSKHQDYHKIRPALDQFIRWGGQRLGIGKPDREFTQSFWRSIPECSLFVVFLNTKKLCAIIPKYYYLLHSDFALLPQ